MKHLITLTLLLILVITISCHNHNPPIIEDIHRNTFCIDYKYMVETDLGDFATNKEYKINDTLDTQILEAKDKFFKHIQELYNNPNIDLPEEYELISDYSNKPDTLIAFYKNGKLTFRFLTAARLFPKENH